jgi:ATP-binding cassette subfamily F protein 3
MVVLTVDNIVKHYGPEPVLAGASFDLRAGEKISLIGPNGAGKTTLLKILMNELAPDQGEIVKSANTRLGYLEQHAEFPDGASIWDVASAALTHVRSLLKHNDELAQQIADASDPAEQDKLAHEFEELQHRLEQEGAYDAERRVQEVLSGLGFDEDSYAQKANTLSGGQQSRLLLAELLIESPEILLLDEPSNHLDLATTEWLENYVSNCRSAVLLVSHDRFFLDKVTSRTLELCNGTIDSYPGNYTKYVTLKEERLQVQRKTFEKQQEEIAKLEDFIRKNKYGQKHAQAEDRRKKLERIELVELPKEIEQPPMRFPAAERAGDIVLRCENLAKSYDFPLFGNLTFDVLRGEKWGIVGPNGCGKTTLLKCILGKETLDKGTVKVGAKVKISYFDQALSGLDPEMEVQDAVRPPERDETTEQQRRDLLAKFGIRGDAALRKVGDLSGGERNRVLLSLLASTGANVLILDEPTNHLDLWARQSLERAIRDFDGTVIFVSHDRYFLNQVADRLLFVEPGRFRVIEGNYDALQHMIKVGLASEARSLSEAKGEHLGGNGKPSKEEKKARDKERRKRKFPYRKPEDIETEISEREWRIEELHASLADPEILRDGSKVKAATNEVEEQRAKIAELYEHWVEAMEMN